MPYLFDIQRLSMENGPGLRTTLFFPGCPLACPWCHNPEGKSSGPLLLFFSDRCIQCASCEETCEDRALIYDPARGPVLDQEKCRACGRCADLCPAEALVMSARQYSLEEIMEIILRDRPYFDRSRGGVTLSGGEPLAQDMDDLEALMREIKKEGIHLAIDTCGAVPRSHLDMAQKYADAFLYDLKHLDPKKHEAFIKEDNKNILDNLVWLSRQGAVIHLRIPVIPGFNGDKEELAAMADWVTRHIDPATIGLLPYHLYGSNKYDRLGLENQKTLFQVPTDAFMDQALKIFIDRGLNQTNIGGAILASHIKKGR